MKLHRFFCVALIFMHGVVCAMEKKPISQMSWPEFQEWKNKRTEASVAVAKKLGTFRSKDEKEWEKLCIFAVPYSYCGMRDFIQCSSEYGLQQTAVSFAVVNGCNNKFIAALIDAGFEFDKAVWNARYGHISPLQIAIKRWKEMWGQVDPRHGSLLTVQLLLERGASLSPKNGCNTLSLFLARPPVYHGYDYAGHLQDCEQWKGGIKYLLALGADPGERPAGHLPIGRGNDAPYMELAIGALGERPHFRDGSDEIFCLSPHSYNYRELVSLMRAHVPEQEVRFLLQRQLVCNRVLKSMQVCSSFKKNLHDMVFGKIFEHTIDNWTKNGRMGLCNADGGISNWLASRWDERQLSCLEKYVCPPKELRQRVEADLKRQLALWARKRRKIDLDIRAIAIPRDPRMNEEETSVPSDCDSSSELGCQVGYCSVQ